MKSRITILISLLVFLITITANANNNPVITSITANYTGTEEIFPSTTLDSLKTNLTVTINYSNGESSSIDAEDYTLTGVLTVGVSVITINYKGQTATFTATVTAIALTGITAKYTGTAKIYTTTPLNNLKSDLTITANYNNGTKAVIAPKDYTLTGSLTAGVRTITVNHNRKNTTFAVTVLPYRMAIGFGLEANMNSRENFAGGASASFDYNLPRFFALGTNFTYSNNFSGITTFEPTVMLRRYFPGTNNAGFFAQLDAGVSIILEDSDTKYLFLGGLRSGYRMIFNRFYVEPYGRVGYPFALGIGVMAGMIF